MDINALHDALASICPIHGVSVGDPADKSTWRIDYDPSATDAQKTAAQAVVTAFDATKPPPPVFTFMQFMALFTPAEQAAIVGSTDVTLKIWLLKAAGAGRIDFADPEVKQGLGYLGVLGLITPTRQAAILVSTPS